MILKVFLGLGSAIAGLIAAGLIILLHAGVATVWVESPEAKFFVPVPIAAVDVALQFVPGEDLRDVQRDLERFAPVISAAMEELSHCPDATLVEVHSGGDYVLVRKVDQDLKINVRTDQDEKFSISVPLHGVQHVLASIQGI
ncbi:MAG: hypothetical protein P8020_11875 [Acidobacteriota bacterium]|jgi:hypothetical protein